METIKDLLDLLSYNVERLYAAEEFMQQELPAIIEKVNHKSLKNALLHHSGLNNEHKKRLQTVYEILKKEKDKFSTAQQDTPLSNHINKGIVGLIEETHQLLEASPASEVIDAAIIASVQKLEHYEISAYGTALAYANQLQLHKVAELLSETLQEEYDVDDLLTALATATLNKEAMQESIERTGTEVKDAADETEGSEELKRNDKVVISERTINSPGGRAGTSHRGYGNGESRGH